MDVRQRLAARGLETFLPGQDPAWLDGNISCGAPPRDGQQSTDEGPKERSARTTSSAEVADGASTATSHRVGLLRGSFPLPKANGEGGFTPQPEANGSKDIGREWVHRRNIPVDESCRIKSLPGIEQLSSLQNQRPSGAALPANVGNPFHFDFTVLMGSPYEPVLKFEAEEGRSLVLRPHRKGSCRLPLAKIGNAGGLRLEKLRGRRGLDSVFRILDHPLRFTTEPTSHRPIHSRNFIPRIWNRFV